jgi:hypothetical protein
MDVRDAGIWHFVLARTRGAHWRAPSRLVQSAAAGDAAIGAAFAVWHALGGACSSIMDPGFHRLPSSPRNFPDRRRGLRSGKFPARWKSAGARPPRSPTARLPAGTSRMEWGSSTLGSRFIVCDPRRAADIKAITARFSLGVDHRRSQITDDPFRNCFLYWTNQESVTLGACPSNSGFYWPRKRESDSLPPHEQDIPRLEDR